MNKKQCAFYFCALAAWLLPGSLFAQINDVQKVRVGSYYANEIKKNRAEHDALGQNETVDLSIAPQVLGCFDENVQICCQQLQEDFADTWTLLAAVFSTPTFSVDFSGVYTVIDQIEVSLSECCNQLVQDFQATWTIIDKLGNDQNATLTIIADFTGPCDPIFITTSTVITAPGIYCLGASLSEPNGIPITINSSNVMFNTNGFSLSGQLGILVGSGLNNIYIAGGGSIQNTTNQGILVDSNTTSVRIEHLYFNFCGSACIRFNNQNTGCSVNNISMRNIGFFGIQAIATSDMLIDSISVQDSDTSLNGNAVGIFIDGAPNNNIKISNLYIANCKGQRFFGVWGFNTTNCLIENMVALGCHSTFGDIQGILFNQSSNLVFKNIFIDTLQATTGQQSLGVAFFDCGDSHARDCIIKNLSAQASYCFRIVRIGSGSGIIVSDSFGKTALGPNASFGVNVEQSPNALIYNCHFENIEGNGIRSNFTGAVCRNIFVKNVTLDGFLATTGTSDAIVDDCVAEGAGLYGFEMPSDPFVITNCVATQNATNYSPNITNIYPIGSSTLAGYNISA